MADVIHQSQGFFDNLNAPARGVLPLQTFVSEPMLPTMSSETGMLAVDLSTETRLAHFDPALYDMRPGSHLVRLMKALLGDAGVGQLRKSLTTQRISSILSGSHFFDLDGFWGALLNVGRRSSELLVFDPTRSVATPEQWDDVLARDARYRERIIGLSQSLPMIGTVAGLKMAAEAVAGAPCEIYEVWPLLNAGQQSSSGRSWDQVETLSSSWDVLLTPPQTWDQLANKQSLGVTGLGLRNEVTVKPLKSYLPTSGDPAAAQAALRQRQEDEYNLTRVMRLLKPAGVLVTIDTSGISLQRAAPAGGFFADSSLYEIVGTVYPRPGLPTGADSPYAITDPAVTQAALQAPPFTVQNGYEWSHNSVTFAINGISYDSADGSVSASGQVEDSSDWQVVTTSGQFVQYTPDRGMASRSDLIGELASRGSVLVAHPYAARNNSSQGPIHG